MVISSCKHVREKEKLVMLEYVYMDESEMNGLCLITGKTPAVNS